MGNHENQGVCLPSSAWCDTAAILILRRKHVISKENDTPCCECGSTAFSSSAVLKQPCHRSGHVVVALDKRVSRFLGVEAHADELFDAGAGACTGTCLCALSALRHRYRVSRGEGSCTPGSRTLVLRRQQPRPSAWERGHASAPEPQAGEQRPASELFSTNASCARRTGAAAPGAAARSV